MKYFISEIACHYFFHSKRIKTYSTMVKGLASEQEFLSSSPAGAVYFFRCGKCL